MDTNDHGNTNKKSENKAEEVHKSFIINWFIENHVATNLLTILILFFGIYTVGFFGLFGQSASIPIEDLPNPEPKTVIVNTFVLGSTPEDIEKSVTTKIEEAIKSIQGIDKIESTTTANSSRVSIRSVNNYDIDDLLDDVKTQVDAISTFPSQVDKILVSKRKNTPDIIWISLYGDVSEKELKTKATELKDKLLLNKQVEKVGLFGDRDFEIKIEISDYNLEKFNLTFSEVAQAIKNSSLDLSVGTINSSQGKIKLRIKQQAYTKKDFENIVLRATDKGQKILIKDVASVIDGFKEDDFFALFNNKPSLLLKVYGSDTSNILLAAKSAKKIAQDFAKNLPKNIKVTAWNDKTTYVQDRIDLFNKNVVMAVILVFILLSLFLNIKLAFWVAFGIPVSFSGALILMKLTGLSINKITLFGFILVLGIIVDDAIVIGESIFTQKRKENNSPQATINGASKVAMAATFGVLTTIAAFFPLTQIDSDMGEIMANMAYVVIFCLIFSLIESKFILPSHLHNIKVVTNDTKHKNFLQKIQSKTISSFEVFIDKIYQPSLKISLKYRYFTLLIFISILILTVSLVAGGIVKRVSFPIIEAEIISVSVEMQPNTPLKTTVKVAKLISNAVNTADELIVKKNNLDGSNIKNIVSYNDSDISFNIFALLTSSEERETSATVIASKWREVIGKVPSVKSINFSSALKFSISDIQIELNGNNLDKIKQASLEVQERVEKFKGIKDISTSLDIGEKEIIIKPKPIAEFYGISKAKLTNEVRAAFYGLQAQRIQRDKDDIRVMIKYPLDKRKYVSDLYNLKIRTNTGQKIPVSAVADLEISEADTTINHTNGKRSIIVYANINKDVNSSEEIMEELKISFFKRLEKKHNITVTLGGEADQSSKTNQGAIFGFVISLFLIYMLLAVALKSYANPLIIMIVIPFGIIGAILAHWATGNSISFPSNFGIIALSGVVVNDSLVFVSSITRYKKKNYDTHKSVMLTGVNRFRPIVLTSLTTFIGLVPLLLETSLQAQFLIPVAISLGFGILFATFLTLYLLPSLYYILDDIRDLFRSKSKQSKLS